MALLGTIPDLRDELRVRLGYLNDTVSLPDPANPAALSPKETILDAALRDALRQINKLWPRYAVGSFPTVADQQSYQPLPAGGRRLVEVFWSDDACATAFATAWPAVTDGGLAAFMGDHSASEGGVRFTTQPGALHIMNRLRSAMERYTGRSNVRMNQNTVYLMPQPSTAGVDVYFVYVVDRFDEIDEIDDDNMVIVEAFWTYAEYIATRSGIAGPGAITKVIGPDGTTIELDARSSATKAKMLLEDFNALLPVSIDWWDGV